MHEIGFVEFCKALSNLVEHLARDCLSVAAETIGLPERVQPPQCGGHGVPVEALIILAVVENRHQMGVVEARQHIRFTAKPDRRSRPKASDA